MRDGWISGPHGRSPPSRAGRSPNQHGLLPGPQRSKTMFVRTTFLMIVALSAAFLSTMAAIGPALALAPVAQASQISGTLV